MTVRQNVIYPLKHRKIARAEAGRKVDEVLELVGLSEYAEPAGGGVCRAVRCSAWRWRAASSYRPQLLLLDEPLSQSRCQIASALRDDLRIILKQTGMTALYVTQTRPRRSCSATASALMRDGKLLQMGSPDEIYNRPADLFVANFTGATNEISGTLIERNGTSGLVEVGSGQRIEVALLHAIATGEKIRIALRPENIALGKCDGSNAFNARVLDRRYQGTQTVYDIDLFGHRLEVLELGTAARHQVGVETPVSLPREGCWPIGIRDHRPTISRNHGSDNFEL